MKILIDGESLLHYLEGRLRSDGRLHDRRVATTQRRARYMRLQPFYDGPLRRAFCLGFGRRAGDKDAHIDRRLQATPRTHPANRFRRTGDERRRYEPHEQARAAIFGWVNPRRRRGEERRTLSMQGVRYTSSNDPRIRALERRKA